MATSYLTREEPHVATSYLTREEMKVVPNLEDGSSYHMGVVEIDEALCTGCQLCVKTCPGSALEMDGKKLARMLSEKTAFCMACGDCVAICEPAAIHLAEPLRLEGRFRFLHRGELSRPRRF